MAKRKGTEPDVAEEVTNVAKARYRFTGGRIAVVHPVIGTVTKDHLEGPKAEIFIKAFKAHDAKANGDWFDKNIETLN